MSDKELKSTIAVSVDGKGVEVGVAAVKKSLESMGAAAASAGVGFNGVATQADEALKKADRSTKAFVAQVKNAATDVKAELDKLNIADKFELKAVSKGLDPALYKPYVDYLRTIVTEQDRLALSAAATGNSVAMSARAMSNAMRGVPAQFTDIVTSLASGQAPLTVLMQQGGQLKDMFGGVGNAFKALGSYVVGLINPISLTVAAVGVLAVAHNQGAKEAEAYAKALILTGNAAGATVGQLQGMAARVAESTGATQGAAAEALTAFANVSGVAVGSYERFAGVAIKIQKELGVSVADTAAKFADLGKAPLEASIKLNDSMHYLTAEVYRQIKALEEHGDKAGAAAIAQKAYADASERAMDGLKANLGTAEKAWRSIAETAKGAWDAMLGVGRATSINDQISSVTKQIAEIQSKAGADGKVSLWEGGGKLSALQEQLRYLTLIKNSQEANAAGDAKRAALQITLQNFDARSIDMLDKKGKMQRELTLAQADGDKLVTAGLITQVDLNKQLAAIREKYKESSKGKTGDDFASQRSAAKEWAEFYEKFTNLADKAAGKVGELTSAQVELEKYLKSPAYANMAEPARQLALESAYAAIAQQQLAKEIAAISKENEAAATAYDQLLKSQGKHNQSLDDAIQKQREHNATIGVSVEAGAALELANMRAHADALERKADLADLIYLDGQYADSLRKEAEKLREFANAKQVGAAKKAANEAYKEWQKAADKINESITDALMKGFESGKGFAENLRDTVVKTFNEMVLRPTVSAIVNPVTQGITGAFQSAGASMLGSAGGSFGASSLFSAAGMSALGESFGASAMATMTGSSFANATVVGQFAGAGATGTGIASTLGAAMPYIAAAVLAYELLRGDKFKSSANTGDSSATYGSNGALLALQTTNGLTKSTTDMAAALQASYMTAAKSLGISLAQTNYNVNTNNGREGENPNTIIDSTVNGRRFSSGEVSNGDTAAMQLAASRAVFSALQGSELPAYLSKMFDGLNAASMTQEQISNTLAYAQSIKQVRDALLETREPLQILKDNVAQGFAALGTSAESFKTDFVAALDAGVSPENLAKWQALQATMTSLADLADKEAKKRDAAAKAIQDSLDKELATATKWADKMGVLQGTTTERQLALNADLATTMNAGTQELIRQVYAQEALQAATTSAKDSLKTFADSLKSLASGVAGAQSRIDDMQLQAQIDAANKANAVAEKFRSLGKSLRDFLDGETLAPSAAFGKLLAKAMGGDGEAMQALPGAATAAINLAKESAATATDFALQKASILSQLSQAVDVANTLAAQTVPVPQVADPMAAAVQNLQDAINELRDGITQSISVDLAARLGAIDTNLSGAIDLTEFRTYFSGLASDDTLQKIFTALDSDSSGVISKLEAIKSNTSNYASVIASDSLLLSRMQSDFNAWFAKSKTGDSATLGAGGPVVTNTGGGTATVSGASGTTQINAGMSVVDAAASNQSLADAWKTQYSSSQTLADNELARAAIDARNWITNFPVGTPLAWAGGSISTNGQFAMWERSPGQFVQINPATGDDIRALAQAYPELLTEWRSEGYRFASGGAFTNSIVRRPTSFDIGQMGEAGPEAIMPLTNIGGKLGVLGIGTNNAALLDELRALRAEVEGLRIEARATATNTNKTAKMLDRAMPDGDAIATRVAA